MITDFLVRLTSVLIIICFVKCTVMHTKDYEIKTVDELFDIIEKDKASMLYQNENNLSLIYKLKDGKMILVPAIGSKGLIFENERKLDELVSKGDIPLEEDDPNPFQINKEKIKNLSENVNYYLKILSDTLGIKIEINNDDSTYYDEINKRIKAIGYDKTYNTLYIPLGIFVGEKIKRQTGAEWQLIKKFGYNPYYEPALVTSNKKYFPWYKLADMLLERKKFDFKYYFAMASDGFETK
jgi:hypothetical protein